MAGLNKYRQEGLKEILETLESVFSQTGIDFYYLIGAIARDIWFSQERITNRTTRDMDFAVMVSDKDQFKRAKELLIEEHKFSASSWNEFTLINPKGIVIDLLPFGEIEVQDGIIIEKGIGLHSIKVNGFKEIAKVGTASHTDEDKTFEVATLPSIILLKLIAYDDRPEHRQKDPQDIAQILAAYFDIEQNSIFERHYDLFDLIDNRELVSAKAIGKEIRIILQENEALKQRVVSILTKHIANEQGNRFVEIMSSNLSQSIDDVLFYLSAIVDEIQKDDIV
jgi:predicted nucleotidyltransferase